MNLKYLAAAATASLLAAGAAQAQPNSVTPDMPNPVAAAQGSQKQHTDDHATTSAETSGSVNPSSGASASGSWSGSTGATATTGTATTASDVGGTTVTTTTVTNGPVPDTAENRAKYGQPMSRAGKRTAPAGN